MRWSRITLDPVCAREPGYASLSPRYVIDLPIISDGRIAFHELAANTQHARVEVRPHEGGTIIGTVVVRDNQCLCVWPHDPDETLPQVRLSGASFHPGGTVTLRPGFGPAQLFEVTAWERLPASGLAAAGQPSTLDPARPTEGRGCSRL